VPDIHRKKCESVGFRGYGYDIPLQSPRLIACLIHLPLFRRRPRKGLVIPIMMDAIRPHGGYRRDASLSVSSESLSACRPLIVVREHRCTVGHPKLRKGPPFESSRAHRAPSSCRPETKADILCGYKRPPTLAPARGITRRWYLARRVRVLGRAFSLYYGLPQSLKGH